MERANPWPGMVASFGSDCAPHLSQIRFKRLARSVAAHCLDLMPRLWDLGLGPCLVLHAL
jgi:hypothetical protein